MNRAAPLTIHDALPAPSIARWIAQMVAVVGLALLWLIVAGFYAKFSTGAAVVYGVLVLGPSSASRLFCPIVTAGRS
jgi:hypothetical protein